MTTDNSTATTITIDPEDYDSYRAAAESSGDYESIAVADRAQYGIVLFSTLCRLGADARERVMALGQRRAQKILRVRLLERRVSRLLDDRISGPADLAPQVDIDVSDL